MTGLSGCGMLGFDFGGSQRDTARITAAQKDMPEEFDPDVVDEKLGTGSTAQSSALFDESVTDDTARITRLENTVERMRNDLDDVMPSIKRLVAIESEIQELVAQLKTLIEQPRSLNLEPQRPQVPADLSDPNATIMTTPPPAEAPDIAQNPAPPQTQAQQPARQSPPATSGGLSISEIRVADYPQKIRMVFESGRKINYDVSFDAQENIVYVETNAREVNLNKSALMRRSAFIQDINIVDRGNNKDIAIALKRGSRLSKSSTISPNKDSRSYRHFFDITF